MADRLVRVVLRGDISGLQASLKSAQGLVKNVANEMTGTSKEADRFRQGLTSVGDSAMKMGLVAAAGVGLITKAAIDWESAWTGVLKTVDGTPAQLTAIEQGLRDMTGVLPATHQELAAIAEAAGALGVETDSILAFTRVAADLGEATNLSSEAAATGLAQLMNVLQTAPEDVSRLGSTLVALGNNGASTESQILDMAQGVAGAGAIIGASESDILALSNALASVGIEAEAGGSAVSKILTDMAQASKNGGAALETFASTAGVSADDFARAFEERPIEAFNMFTQGLGRISDEGGNVFGVLEQLGQTDVRVSRALLTMAKSGDLLTDSLATGAAEWERNQALADEAGKRYDTTAAQVSIAWNNIKDSAIDAGQGMLPVVESVASAVGTMTDAFGALPDGISGSVGVIGAVGAAGLLAVAGVSKLVNTVTGAREALSNLGEVAPRSAGVLGTVGKAAGVAAAAFAAMQVASQFLESGDRAGVQSFTKALLDLESGSAGAAGNLDKLFSVEGPGNGFFGETYRDINNLNDAIEALNPGKFEGFREGAQSLFGFETRSDAAEKSFRQVDAALTGLVSSGASEDAARLFADLSEKMRDSGMSTKEISKLFPDYENALAGVSVEQKKAAESTDALAEATQDAAAKMGQSVEEYEAAQKAAADTASAFTGLGDSLNDSEVSLSDWIAELEKQNEALANFRDNAIEAGQKGLDEGLIASLQAAGPEGALRLAELADASESEIERANDAFRAGEVAASSYADVVANIPPEAFTEFKTAGADGAIETAVEVASRYDMTPDQVRTVLEALDYTEADIKAVLARLKNLDGKKAQPQVRLDTSGVDGQVRYVQRLINGITGKTVGIRVAKNGQGGTTTGSANGGAIPRAAGGEIVGPGTGTSDSIPAIGPGAGAYLLSNGEHVLTAREVDLIGGQSAVYAMRAAIRSQQFAFAGGGSVGSSASSSSPSGFLLPPGAQFRLVGPNMIEFVDSRIEAHTSNDASYGASKRRGR